MKKVFNILLINALSFSLWGQSATIYRTKDMKIVSTDSLAIELSAANVVFFGEEHDDSLGHVAQYQLMQQLQQRNAKKLALSLEMFETDCQTALDEYLNGFISEDRFLKDSRPWPNYKNHYRPMVELAKQKGLSVVAANAPRRYVNMVSRRGMGSLDSLSKTAKKLLPPLPFDTLGGAYAQKFNKIMGEHATQNPRIYHSQNLWDASMAYAIAQHLKRNKNQQVYHLCGRFHSDERLGTVAQLRKQKPKLVVKTISCTSEKNRIEEEKEPNGLARLADFVIITKK